MNRAPNAQHPFRLSRALILLKSSPAPPLSQIFAITWGSASSSPAMDPRTWQATARLAIAVLETADGVAAKEETYPRHFGRPSHGRLAASAPFMETASASKHHETLPICLDRSRALLKPISKSSHLATEQLCGAQPVTPWASSAAAARLAQ